MNKTGFYIIKDKFFEDMPDSYLKGNKARKVVGMLKRGFKATLFRKVINGTVKVSNAAENNNKVYR